MLALPSPSSGSTGSAVVAHGTDTTEVEGQQCKN